MKISSTGSLALYILKHIFVNKLLHYFFNHLYPGRKYETINKKNHLEINVYPETNLTKEGNGEGCPKESFNEI